MFNKLGRGGCVKVLFDLLNEVGHALSRGAGMCGGYDLACLERCKCEFAIANTIIRSDRIYPCRKRERVIPMGEGRVNSWLFVEVATRL